MKKRFARAARAVGTAAVWVALLPWRFLKFLWTVVSSEDFFRKFLLALMVPLAAGIFGMYNTKAATAPQFVDLAIDLLRDDPKGSLRPLREWAVDLLDERGNADFTEEERRTLLSEPLPGGPEWLMTAGLGAICEHGATFSQADTVEFALRTYGMRSTHVADVKLWVTEESSSAIVFADTVPFAPGEVRASRQLESWPLRRRDVV